MPKEGGVRFEDLEVWRRAARLSSDLYRGLRTSPDYGFRDQVTRAGLSVASNIAEGYERTTSADCAKFLDYAMGSLAELRTQLYIGVEAGLVAKEHGHAWIRETRELSAMVRSLARTVRMETRPTRGKRRRVASPPHPER
jgi:four helix bundle protein